jgi:hypothetical protein
MLSNTPSEDVDTLFRLMVTIGTLSQSDREMRSVARDMGIQVRARGQSVAINISRHL